MRRVALPLADAAALAGAARRTAVVWAALVLLALGAIVLAYRALGPLPPVLAPTRAGATVPVIDVSGSISPEGYRLVRRVLESVASGRSRVGLVLFSDSVEEALPPGAPPGELLAYVRALRPASGQLVAATPDAAQLNPWDANFSRGTKISLGLSAARRLLDRAGGGRVVLLSDLLDDPGDTAALRHELLGYAHDPLVRLQVVRLPGAGTAYLGPYRHLAGQPVAFNPPARADARAPGVPLWIPILVVAVALVAAASELLAAPLGWRRAA